MCQQCGLEFLEFESNRPGAYDDLPFTANEFVNACLMAQDGPFNDDNDNWTRLARMYNRMVTLRIDVVQYCEDVFPNKLVGSPVYSQFIAADLAHRNRAPLPFGLPFSAKEYLAICREFTESEQVYQRNSARIHQGSNKLFLRMTLDLASHQVNVQDFLADHVPEDLEKNPFLLRLLAAAQGEHTQNYEINFTRFMVSITAPGGSRDGRLVGPMTHFQAAMFVQTLKESDTTRIPDDHKQLCALPHGDCDVNVPLADVNFVSSPCCDFPSACAA